MIIPADKTTEVRWLLTKINNMVANCELPAKEANAIFYSANLVLKALEMEAADKKRGKSIFLQKQRKKMQRDSSGKWALKRGEDRENRPLYFGEFRGGILARFGSV